MDLSESSTLRPTRFYRSVVAGVWRGFGRDDCAGMAAAVAYHFIFSFFAMLFFLACVATQFGKSQENLDWIVAVLGNFLPPQGVNLARDNIGRFMSPISGSALPLALILSLWTASNVVEMVMKALNRIYSVAETRPLWQTRLLSMILVATLALFFVVAFNMAVFGDEILRFFDFNADRSVIGQFISTVRWPLVFLTTGGAALLIYFLAPNFRGQRRRVALPGAIFFTISWQVANFGFDRYVNRFADFGHIYGPLAAAMVVLMWVYLSSMLLLLGGEINAHIARHLPRKRRAEQVASPIELSDVRPA